MVAGSGAVAPGSPSFAHLFALSDVHGVFEHALFDVPRREHGYCVDDVARALIVVVREPDQTAELAALAETSLAFLEGAVDEQGFVHNRMDATGAWTDDAGLGDWWGRAIWALGVTAAYATTAEVRARALVAFHRAAQVRSPHVRAMAFAALGAAEALSRARDDLAARALVLDGVGGISHPRNDQWEWPEPRLTYANAVLPEVLLASATATDNPRQLARGLSLLRFLVSVETGHGHLSVTGAGGRGPAQHAPQFDQQPIEVAALADACARAFDVTGDPVWRDAVASAWGWFLGDNDAGTVMFDHESGAGFDGLEAAGRNENRGAESTLAALSTYQQARRLGVLELASV